MWRRLGFFVALMLCLWCGESRAEARDPAAAEALFRAGREAFESGDYANALVRFQEAYRLDPTPGALLNQAICEAELGQLANAWQNYRRVLELLPPADERVRLTASRLRTLEQRLAWVIIELAPQAPKQSKIERGAVELSAASLGIRLPFDPGRHELLVSAPEYRPRRYVLNLREGQRQILIVTPGPPLAPRRPPSDSVSQPVPPPPVSEPPASGDKAPPTLGYVLIGVGGAALTVAAASGVMLGDRLSTVEEQCYHKECSPIGLEAGSSGRRLRAVTVVAVVVGVVSASSGAYLVLSNKGGATQVAWGHSF